MTRRNLDLWTTVALAAAGVAVQLGPMPTAVRVFFGLPLVLLCPGYALMAALFPGRSLGWPERALFSFGLSLAVAILGTVALTWSLWGLQTGVWAGLFFGVTLAASLVGARRRAAQEPVRAGRPQPRLRIEHWALMGLAGLVTVAAVAVARMPGPVTGVLGYTVLWMTPDVAPSGVPNVRSVHLGINSSELVSTRYRLQLTLDGQLILDEHDINLMPGESWERQIELPQSRGMVEATLYRVDNPGLVYRRVSLAPSQ